MKLEPIKPFEPMSTDVLPEGEQWIAQIKWDGVRVLTYFDGQDIKLFNRKINERTFHYPEITDIKSYCNASSVILDGEVIALGPDGKPSFHQVMRRDGIRRLEKVKEVQKQVGITYMVFDVIYRNGKWLDKIPLKQRIELLAGLVIPNDHVQLVTVHEDPSSLFHVIESHSMEGIVLKDLTSPYFINKKNHHWLKKKNYKDIIAVIGGVTLRNDIVNSVLLGVYDENGQLCYIGHAGTGKLTQDEWREFTKVALSLRINDNPFNEKPARIGNPNWIEPRLTVKIQFMEWTENHHLRQPSIQSFVQVNPRDCTFDS